MKLIRAVSLCLTMAATVLVSGCTTTENYDDYVYTASGMTPLMWAVQEGELSKVKRFVERGDDVNAVNVNNVSVLNHTTFSGHKDVARYLIANGARPADETQRLRVIEMLGLNKTEREALGLIPGQSRTMPSAPSNGVSREELAQIVASAVKNAQPQAPAPAREVALLASPVPNFSSPKRPDDLAVIVGIETYSDIASKASYAERDADAFKAHVRALGVPERNIVLLKGAKAGRASLEKILESWLPRLAKSDSRVYFYFSGHGAPDVKTGQAYLVPWDGDPNFLENTAYPVARLYKKLGELPAKQVLVAMDSCFSGAGGRSVLASGVRPLVGKINAGVAPAKLTVLAASASDEISGSLDEKGHGAFTYFLLQGLAAGKTTPRALTDYLTPRVQDEARRLNRDQTPQLMGDGSWSLR